VAPVKRGELTCARRSIWGSLATKQVAAAMLGVCPATVLCNEDKAPPPRPPAGREDVQRHGASGAAPAGGSTTIATTMCREMGMTYRLEQAEAASMELDA